VSQLVVVKHKTSIRRHSQYDIFSLITVVTLAVITLRSSGRYADMTLQDSRSPTVQFVSNEKSLRDVTKFMKNVFATQYTRNS